jgi:glycosyltransferase involved in cell wall biosynthesis
MTSRKPKISVIVPTYNRSELLPRAINSILNQTFKDFELIIVDDGSTDNTKKIIEKYSENDSRIKYIYQENSGGPPRPKNTGIKIAKGNYIAFLDSDDEWLPSKLEEQIKKYIENDKNHNIGLVGCGAIIINKATKEKEYFTPPRFLLKKTPEILQKTIAHSCSSIIIKKTVFEDSGLFDENIKVLDDRDLYIRILNKYKFIFIQKPLFKYYVHDNNVTNKKNEHKSIKDEQLMLKKYKKIYLTQPDIYYDKLKEIGRFYVINSQPKLARKIFIKAIKIKPFSKIYINIFLSFNPSLYKKSLLLYKKIFK